jgi:hypothetical protein
MKQLLLASLLCATAAALPADGPDIPIRAGTVVSTAVDYEMDGTMWAAVIPQGDSGAFVYNSTDHGLHWVQRFGVWGPGRLFVKVGLVVGEGDSGFVHIFLLDTLGNGDLLDARFNRAGTVFDVFDVCVGPDTVRDFAVCRDYTGSNYWLYAAVTDPETGVPYQALRFLRSSTYGREWYVTDSYSVQVQDPQLSAGAGTYIHFACHSGWLGGSVHLWTNRLYLSSSAWTYGLVTTDSEQVADPVIAPAFTLPESSATVWALWSQDYQNSGDWDIKYSYSTDGGTGWSAPAFLAGSAAYDECFPDLRNYTSAGNQYVNASYISDDNAYRAVYRQYVHAANPTQWSDTLRINDGSAGTGSAIRPRLCYTPGGPFTGAGCVFVGSGLNGCWWNAPYPVSVAEAKESAIVGQRLLVEPSVGRGPFRITAPAAGRLAVYDGAGRCVREFAEIAAVWDGRDGRGRLLPRGVYLVRFAAGDHCATEKLVLQR